MVKVKEFGGVRNQFLIHTDEGVYFQSYDSIIAFRPYNGKIVIGGDWEYSRTTGKYRNMFLGETKAETQKKLDDGKYTYDPDLTIT